MLQLLLCRGQLLLEVFDQGGIGRKWGCRKTGDCIHDELLTSRAELWNTIILFSVYGVGINSVVVHLASVPRPISRAAEASEISPGIIFSRTPTVRFHPTPGASAGSAARYKTKKHGH